MSELDMLSVAASGMDAERIALEASARNLAASEATTGTFTKLVPRFAASGGDEPGDDEPGDGGFPDDGPGVRFVGMGEQPGSADSIMEMVAVLDAQRAFEADASMFDAGKRFAEREIDLGRS